MWQQKSARVIHPNPYINQQLADQRNPLAMYQGNIVVMPYGFATINKQTTGVVGKLRDDYCYPPYLFYDVGCGHTVMIFDDQLNIDSQKVNEVIDQVNNEMNLWCDQELDDHLPDTSQYNEIIDPHEVKNIYTRVLKKFVQSGIKDPFVQTRIIPEIISPTLKQESTQHSKTFESIINNTFSRKRKPGSTDIF